MLLLYPMIEQIRNNAFAHLTQKAMIQRTTHSLLSQNIAALLRLRRATSTQPTRHSLPFACNAHARCTRHRTLHAPEQLHPAIGKIKEYIDERYGEPITLSTLAQVAHVSPFHLLRIFRDAEGTTPGSYLNDVRIHNAQSMLERGCSIAETALATGFYDQSHFTNVFRRATGITPRQHQQKSKILQEKEG